MVSTLAHRLRTVLLGAAWLVAGAAGLRAQNTVNLQGHVSGAAGAPLVAAQVTVTNRETGQQRNAVTSAEGNYTIVGLPPGAYHVSLRLLGYQPQERDIELLVGQHATLDVQLREAAVALEGVEVVHQREPSFEVQRNDVSSLVVTNEILNLPLNSRNTINLAAIVPVSRPSRPPKADRYPPPARCRTCASGTSIWTAPSGKASSTATSSGSPRPARRYRRRRCVSSASI